MPTLPTHRLWAGHATPTSVYAYPVAYVTLVVAVYRRDHRLLLAVLGLVAAGPFLSTPPADDTRWGTRVVLGERILLARGRPSLLDGLLLAAFAPVPVLTLRAARAHRPVRTAGLTLAMLVGMGLFFGRMARLYGRAERSERERARAGVVDSTNGPATAWSSPRAGGGRSQPR